MLVGTHLDTAKKLGCTKTEELMDKVVARFSHVFTLEENIVMINSHAAGSQEIKTFKNLLQLRKQQMIEVKRKIFWIT